MTDKVLTDEEKDALLEGVATGEVEVQSSTGPAYAEVQPFEIPARSRLESLSKDLGEKARTLRTRAKQDAAENR